LTERLVERLQKPELAKLWDELARRMGSSAARVASVSLRDLEPGERVAISDLLGSDREIDASVTLRTSRLTAALSIEIDELRELVERLRGPLPNRAAEREAERVRREKLWAWAQKRFAPWPLAEWLSSLRTSGVPRGDCDAHQRRLEQIGVVLDRLPSDGVVLSMLARDATGDPHGLDWGTWTTNRVLDALSIIHKRPSAENAEQARSLWDLVGVVPDRHSVGVTVLGLRAVGSDPLAVALRDMAKQAEPFTITLSQLQRWPVHIREPRAFLFENAFVLSRAALRDWGAPPIICTAGWPNTAVFLLCKQLRESGAVLFHHGDFDPKGIEIAGYLRDRAGVEPWRMTAEDYRPLASCSITDLACSVAETNWAPDLATAMNEKGKIVYEEDVVDALLDQLVNLEA
jgi:uncharacterized protein (TIGR02679 family)